MINCNSGDESSWEGGGIATNNNQQQKNRKILGRAKTTIIRIDNSNENNGDSYGQLTGSVRVQWDSKKQQTAVSRAAKGGRRSTNNSKQKQKDQQWKW